MAAHSRFHLCKPHLWHIQEAGDGPLILLIHGAGGATQSWRHLFPLLAKSYRVIAIDLPGQGFTKLGALQRCNLKAMAADIKALCREQKWHPSAIVGHSAGASIALQIALSAPSLAPRVIGINSALNNFQGLAGLVFPAVAKTLAMIPMVADIFSATGGSRKSAQKLIASTGSILADDDITYYQSLFSNRTHVNATLNMMAQWDLDPLLYRLPEIESNVSLIAADADQAVPFSVSQKAAQKLQNADFTLIPRLGHLMHEEDADLVYNHIHAALSS